jgi:AraC-like DNA-binding protein
MKGFESSILNGTISIVENEEAKVYIIRNKNGEGVVSKYEILDDIDLLYSDFHINEIISEEQRDIDCLAIDYCYEGRLECSLKGGGFVYQKPGDLSIDSRNRQFKSFKFPLEHYHSISLIFSLPKAQKSLEKTFPGYPVNLKKLRDKFLSYSYPCFLNNNVEINNIFESLRNINIDNKNTFIITKILELLLLLDSMDSTDWKKTEKQIYFHKSNVDKIKEIHKLMVNNLEKNYTLNDLSKRFNITLTAMTSCFKGAYGKPINTYIREYRMSFAAKELLVSELSIAEIANRVGYTNPSKFSGAFNKVIGVLPKEYRARRGEKNERK